MPVNSSDNLASAALVSVTIPLYNMEQFVADTIQSVLNQTYGNFEIIVADDGSTDRSLEIVRGFNDPRIKVLDSPFDRPSGPAVALNRAIRASNGQFIAMLAADDLFTKDSLELRLGAFRPSDLLVCGQVIDIKENCSLEKAYGLPQMNRTKWFYGPSNLLRRETFERYGLLDERLPQRGSDRELWTRLFGRDRLRTSRGTFTCMPDVVGYFRIRRNSLQHSYKDLPPEQQIKLYAELQKIIDKHEHCLDDLELLTRKDLP